jgi:hypothetical protein
MEHNLGVYWHRGMLNTMPDERTLRATLFGGEELSEQWTVPLDATIVATSEIVSADLDGEVVMLNVQDGTYYGLDGVGVAIWKLIQQPTPVRQILDSLLTEYQVERGSCERDLMELLKDLAVHGLVKIGY